MQSSKVSFSPNVYFENFSFQSQFLVGKECKVVGWGLDKINHGTYALRQTPVTILDAEACKRKHYHTSEAKWKNIVCVGSPEKDLLSTVVLGLVSESGIPE